MIFKKDNGLMCEFCGHTVMRSVSNDGVTNTFTCSNIDCSNWQKYDNEYVGEIPDWVIIKDLHLGNEMNDGHVDF